MKGREGTWMLYEQHVVSKNIQENTSELREISVWIYVIAIGLVILGAVVILPSDLANRSRLLGATVPPMAGIAVVIVGSLVQVLTRKRIPIAQMVALYAMVSLGFMLLGEPFIVNVIVHMASPAVQTELNPDIGPYYEIVSPWVTVKDMTALQGFWGSAKAIQWTAWILPLIMWTMFFGVVLFVVFCLLTLVRRQWIELERLTFPVVTPVVEMIVESKSESKSIWLNSLFYIGMIVPLLIEGLTVLNSYFPAVPRIPFPWRLEGYFPGQLKSALGEDPPFWFTIDSLMLGIAFLVPREISLSIWFFVVLFNVERMFLMLSGFWRWGYLPVSQHKVQAVFGPVGFGLVALWLARHEIRRMIREAIVSGKRDSQEPISYRMALCGLVGGIVAIVLFCHFFLGLSVFAATLYFILMFLAMLGYARLRAQAGATITQTAPYMHGVLHWVLNKEKLGGFRRYGFGFFWNMEWPSFGAVSGTTIESFYLAETTNLKKSSLVKGLLVTFIIVAAAGFITALQVIHKHGMMNLNDWYINTGFRAAFEVPLWYAGEGQIFLGPWIAVGTVVVTGVLTYLQTNFWWWPLHPIGFVIMGYDGIHAVWGSFFLAWVIKTLLMKYAGPQVLTKAKVAFIGMIVGGVIIGIISTLIGTIVFWVH
jgi:hypothetical protein